MPVTADKPAPYATVSSVLDLIARFRSRGLPTPVTGEVLGRAGIKGTLIPRTLQSLQTLDLIDAVTGMPTPTFEGLRLAPETEFKQRLADWLRGSYADVFAFVDPSKDGEARIRDAFRSYQPVGQQERMVSLFQGLCAAAGLIAAKPVSSGSAAPSPSNRLRAVPPLRSTASKTAHAPIIKPGAHRSPGGLPPALTGLLESLPEIGSGWTKSERDKFVATFQVVLDYCYPVGAKVPRADDPEMQTAAE